MKLMSISAVMPYNNIGHAGGKTYNYYVKNICNEEGLDLFLLVFSSKKELELCDLAQYNIRHKIILTSGTLLSNFEHLFFDIIGKVTPYGRNKSYYKKYKIMQYLKKLEKKNELPDIIELEWTSMFLLAKYINKKYPNIKLIGSEHDVSFLGAYRKYLLANGKHKLKLEKEYITLKAEELEAGDCCNIVMPQNVKDADLLIENGISRNKIHILTPYFHNMSHVERKNINHDILFWGAMYRPENYESALWFIDNVMPLLKDTDVRFIVAGNRPPKQLLDRKSDKVIITGFVEDETPYFENSMCFVAPLLTGAGIKVKIIEALSAGIPILTNEIGIEGIPAVDGESYFHCTKPQEYIDVMNKLLKNEIDIVDIEKKQRLLIKEKFNLKKAVEDYLVMIKNL